MSFTVSVATLELEVELVPLMDEVIWTRYWFPLSEVAKAAVV